MNKELENQIEINWKLKPKKLMWSIIIFLELSALSKIEYTGGVIIGYLVGGWLMGWFVYYLFEVSFKRKERKRLIAEAKKNE